ncbi:shikimate kinase [Ideonella margarita]|uniref:Shikimate kinase n=1 Tax=Ideonella margarita TaxID=2984191 RepID=A0ABU9C1F3_9BURK
MSVVLVGLPGSGKSTVGRHVARLMNLQFVDADTEIERQLGTSIRVHFEQYGEQSFRDHEQQVIAELCARPDLVVATGGGAVLREANRAQIKRSGHHVVYLRATPDDLARRLRHDTQRPLLQGVDPLKRLRDLFAERDPFYREVADFGIDTGRTSVHTLANLVAMQLDMLPAKPQA